VGDQPALQCCLNQIGLAVRDVFERLVGRADPALLDKR
jgi:hypothetical protein